MHIRLLVLVGGALVAAALLGCRRDSVPGHDRAKQLTLYSIDGRELPPGQEPKAGERFYGYPVLGKVEITAADDQQEILGALEQGLARSDGKMAKCFWPRHAIRIVEVGKATDCVICFECYQLVKYEGNARTVKPITREPQAAFNKQLKKADIPLAPGMVGEGQ